MCEGQRKDPDRRTGPVSEGVTLNGSMAETPEGETSYIIFK